jgi:hypothetical protein
MVLTRLAAIAALTLLPALASAQSHQPYAGLEARPTKALSREQIAGRGMELALAAELNGYPGPLHVLEHAEQLTLSADQRERIQKLFSDMKGEAVPLGEKLVAREADLDRQFVSRSISPQNLSIATAAIGATQGALRAAHLKYHLLTLDILSTQQVARYAELRGYAGQHQGHHPRRH